MEKIISTLFHKYIGKPVSIIFLLLILLLCCIPYCPNESLRFTITVIVGILIFMIYVFTVIKNTTLPKAKKGSLAVLVAISAESEQLFKDIKFKLVKEFNAQLSQISSTKINIICINTSTVKKYDFYNKKFMIETLEKCNCIFAIDLIYSVDEESKAENYEIKTNMAVIHPKYRDEIETILRQDMTILSNSIKRVNFNKVSKIDTMNFAAQYLSFMVKYFIGFIFMLSNNRKMAIEQFEELYNSVNNIKKNIPFINLLKDRLPDRCVNAYYNYGMFEYNLYWRDMEKGHLDVFEQMLIKIDSIKPNTYGYFLSMASIQVLKYRNIRAAWKLIDNCKKFEGLQEWRYSEAFLRAYEAENPLTVQKKYTIALKYPYNALSLIEFIEYILEKENDRYMLHLALGILYESVGNIRLMKKHFSLFLKKTADMLSYEKINETVANKISSCDCEANTCEHQCDICEISA